MFCIPIQAHRYAFVELLRSHGCGFNANGGLVPAVKRQPYDVLHPFRFISGKLAPRSPFRSELRFNMVHPPTITVSAHTQSPSFVPGSSLRATITLHANCPSTSRAEPSRSTRVDYIVCEVSGRWSTDRSWLVSHAHATASRHILDNHLEKPIASSHTPRVVHVPAQPDSQPYPWSASLSDANLIGGGGRAGHSGVIFRSAPLVVCEREQITSGSRVCFEVDCVLPEATPPTFRGVAVRYAYALHIVIKFPDAAAPKLIRVPFRIVTPGGTAKDESRARMVVPVPTPRGVGPFSNAFLEEKETTALSMSARLLNSAPPDDIEIALALSLNGRLTPYNEDVNKNKPLTNDHRTLSNLRELPVLPTPRPGMDIEKKRARRRNVIPVYAITQGSNSIARLYLSKKIHHLGDTLSAIFHFQGDRPCYRLGARLEAHEVINPDYAVGQNTSNAEQGVVFRKIYGEHGEFVMSSKNTSIAFSIPHDAPPSFTTSVVSVRWLLHFVFLIPQAKGRQRVNGAATHRVSVDDDIAPLLNRVHITENGVTDEVEMGWEGGPWPGEDPHNWTHLPQEKVDFLKWTLPIIVSGQPGSQWGNKSSTKLVHIAATP